MRKCVFLPDKDRLQRITHEEPIMMMIFLFGVLNDEQRALVERIFHEHRVHFQRISFKIVKSEEAAEDVVSTAFVKIMDNIEKISELPWVGSDHIHFGEDADTIAAGGRLYAQEIQKAVTKAADGPVKHK